MSAYERLLRACIECGYSQVHAQQIARCYIAARLQRGLQ